MNLSLAWRNVWRNKMRSLIIMISVAIGLFAGIFVLGLYEGMLNARVRTVIDSEVAHLQIHHPNFKDDFDPAFTLEPARIKNSLQNILTIQAVAYRVITQGMLSTTTGSAGVQINGIDSQEEIKVSHLAGKIKEGAILDPLKRNGILIGKKLAEKMKVKLGSKLVLTFTDNEANITSGAFRVVGIYQTINAPLDELHVYVNHNTLTSYLGLTNVCHEVAILVSSDGDVEEAKLELQKLFPEYKVQTWRENSPETDLMVTTIDQYSAIIIVIIMIALAFGVINTMLMSVLERTREIGMLTALGMNRRRVFTLVLSETLILTMVGVPLGLLASWFTILFFAKRGIDIASFSEDAMSGFGFSSMIYPEFPAESIGMVLMIVICTALFASLFPSLKAIKLQPADALRQ